MKNFNMLNVVIGFVILCAAFSHIVIIADVICDIVNFVGTI